ncbi:MAG: phosphodiester glycosidase family protein [Armatimonadota bacterium]|nr:phosphodiester glycosidase family protein [bacterium]
MSRLLSIVLFFWLVVSGECWASSISYAKVKVGKTVAHTVVVNLADPQVRVSVALAKGGAGCSEPFKAMVNRVRPAVAITGTFFDTKTLIPTGDIAMFGTVVHSGCIGSALCIDSDNKASIIPLREGRQCAWTGYETVLCCGPTLVADGKVTVALKQEGFRNSLCAPARRTAVGITNSGKLLILAINRSASLHDTARAMLKLGAHDALCLDGGSSTGLYCTGRFFAVPSRRLTNCLVVYSSLQAYNEAKIALAPARVFAKAESKPSLDFDLVSMMSHPIVMGVEPEALIEQRR